MMLRSYDALRPLISPLSFSALTPSRLSSSIKVSAGTELGYCVNTIGSQIAKVGEQLLVALDIALDRDTELGVDGREGRGVCARRSSVDVI